MSVQICVLTPVDDLTVERFDLQVLPDTFEEQLPVVVGPAAFVILCDLAGIAFGYIREQNNIHML